jgi:hypothetical protein
MTADSFPFLDELRAELVRAARDEQARRRPRRRLALAAGAAALVAALAALGLLVDRSGSSALAITHDEDGIVVRIADANASPEELARELRAAGIQAQVRAVPVSPSVVGKWVDIDGVGKHEEIAHSVDFRLPAGFKGRLRLEVGRPARPGERYALVQGAFRPGEPLRCKGIEGMAPAEAETAIRRLGYGVVWQLVTTYQPPDRNLPKGPFERPVRERPQGVIVDARLPQDGTPLPIEDGAWQRTIQVTVAPADDPIITEPNGRRRAFFRPVTRPRDCG